MPNNFSAAEITPDYIRGISPYIPSAPDPVLMERYGVTRLHRLNNNENPLGPEPSAKALLEAFEMGRASIYPSGDSYFLKFALAERFGMDPEQFLVGNGSNEAIACVVKAFCQQGDNIITADRTYATYEWIAEFSGIEPRLVPLDENYKFDLSAMLRAADEHTKIFFICNPNNPTNTWHSEEELCAFIEAAGNRIVVIDEAYCEFVEDPGFPDGMKLLKRYPNLIVFRTFSKMYGLAALRVGYLCGGMECIDMARRAYVVYSVNALGQAAAASAVKNGAAHIEATRALVRETGPYVLGRMKDKVEYFKDGKLTAFIDDFQERVHEAPDAEAITDVERSLTRAEVDEISDKIAGLLRKRGVGPGEAVPVMLPRSSYYVCAMLGVCKARAALICLDVNYPAERIATIKADSGAKLVIDSAFLEAALAAPAADRAPFASVHGDTPAYIIYTSGSTGKPKGILHDRESLERGCRRCIAIGMQTGSAGLRWCSITPFTFIAMSFDVIMPLALGWPLYIAADEMRKDVPLLKKTIVSHKINGIFLPPQLLKNFGSFPKSLSLVFTGSEQLKDFDPPKNVRVISLYGLSETFPGVASFEPDRFTAAVPLGRPIGCRLVIIGDDGALAAQGTEGEICLAGHFATIYINDPEATKKTFTKNPYAEGAEDTELVRTGDNGYIDKDGSLIYVNRRDWMMKVNGQRVEPGEVETVLSKIPGVKQAVAKGFRTGTDSMMIAAFYTAGPEADEEQIRAATKEKLPSYMVPSVFVRLDKFPLNSNGKLDRKSLALPSEDETVSPDEMPRGEAEEKICAAFARILGKKAVGRSLDFFRAGGDSVAAIRLTAALAEAGFDIPTALLRMNAAPAALAEALKSARQDDGLPAMSEPATEGPFEMTDESKMMAELENNAAAECPYQIFSMRFEINGEIDAERLESALERLRTENDIFSLRCSEDGKTYIPCGGREGDFTLRYAAEEGRNYIYMTAPHLMYDRLYLEMLLKNLADIYNDRDPEPLDSMRAVSSWFEAAAKSPLFKEAEAYWKQTAERSLSFCPLLAPDIPDKKWRFVCVSAKTSAERLDVLCAQYGATRYEILYAAFHKMLSEQYGDVVITGTASNLRTLAPLRRASGCLAYRSYVMTERSRASFGELVDEIKTSIYKSQRYALTAPRTVIDQECADFPVYMFNYWSAGAGAQETCFGEAKLGGFSIIGEEYTFVPMVLHIEDNKETISIDALARGGLFNEAALAQISADYIKTLESLKNYELGKN